MTVVPAFGDAGRSGVYQAGGLPQRAEVAWRARTSHPVVASPTLADGVLIVADAGGFVHAFDAATGELRWRRADLDHEWGDEDGESAVVVAAPAVWNTWVFVEENEFQGCIYVHDIATGEVVHTIADGGCPTVVGDMLLVHELNDGVWALSLPTFETVWQHKPDIGFSGWVQASPAISADGVGYAALGFEGNHTHSGVTAFAVATGEEVFRRRDEYEPCPLGGADEGDDEGPEDWVLFSPSHAVLAEGLVWMLVDRDHQDDGLHVHDMPWGSAELVGLDPTTGEQRWIHRLDLRLESRGSESVAVADGVVYFTAYQGGDPDDDEAAAGEYRLHAVDIATRQTRWTRPLPSGGAGSAVIADGVVYKATGTGQVLAFDALTGEPRWSLDVGEPIHNSYDVHGQDYGANYEEDGLAVLPVDGMLYVRTANGIVALR